MASPVTGKSEALFQILFEKSADAIFVLDLQGTIERANQTACHRLQYTLEELVGRKVSEFHSPESRANVTPILQTLKETGSVRTDIVHQARDGTTISTEINSHVVDIDGQPHIVTTARDISERKRAEVELRESAARYRQLFENTGTANALFDRDLRLVITNQRAAQLLEVAGESLVGKTVEEIFGPDLGARFRLRVERTVETGTSESLVLELPLPRGTRWFQTSYNPLVNETGAFTGLQIIAQDITELHHANERLRQNEKLEWIGVLAGGIAHDFNNLLAGLSGHLDLARMHLQEDRPAEALVRLDKSTPVFDRAKSLTRQLLTFSKGGAPIRELHILAPLLREWAEFALSGSEVSLILDLAPDLWLCECDALQIAQVVDNLLINARQSTPPGGTVVLKAENVTRQGPYLAVSVTDQGPGIPAESLERIFDPFFTTKAKGSGLGLATSRSIMAQHNGSLEVQTCVDHGATFTLYLPALPGRKARPQVTAAAEFVGSGRAMVMDDEESVRDTVGEILTTLGFEVTRARNGHDALAFDRDAREQARPFEVALLDLTIPGGLGGLETAKRLRAQGSACRLLAMSGYSEHSGKTNLDEGGFLGVLAKPFSRKELSRLLSRVFSG